MKKYFKQDIDDMILSESRNAMVFRKKHLQLKEDNKNSYVEPSSDNVSSLSSDLTKSKTENPTDDNFIVNANSYDGNRSNNTVTLDVSGSNPADASKNYQRMTQNPNVKRLMANTNVNAKIHLKSESINRLRESSVPFTKKEIKNLFK